MTTPTPSGPTSGPSFMRSLSSPRALAAWALVAYAALSLLFSLILWIAGDGSFSGRSRDAGFDNLVVGAMPVVAVLLAVHLAPVLPRSKLIVTVALIEYAVALFFGIVTLLVGLGAEIDSVNDGNDWLYALNYLIIGLANLGLIAVAAYVVLRAFVGQGGRLPVKWPATTS